MPKKKLCRIRNSFDNEKIYRSAGFEYLAANLGITLLRAEPFTPTGKGYV